jgi:hypothetical protein
MRALRARAVRETAARCGVLLDLLFRCATRGGFFAGNQVFKIPRYFIARGCDKVTGAESSGGGRIQAMADPRERRVGSSRIRENSGMVQLRVALPIGPLGRTASPLASG